MDVELAVLRVVCRINENYVAINVLQITRKWLKEGKNRLQGVLFYFIFYVAQDKLIFNARRGFCVSLARVNSLR